MPNPNCHDQNNNCRPPIPSTLHHNIVLHLIQQSVLAHCLLLVHKPSPLPSKLNNFHLTWRYTSWPGITWLTKQSTPSIPHWWSLPLFSTHHNTSPRTPNGSTFTDCQQLFLILILVFIPGPLLCASGLSFAGPLVTKIILLHIIWKSEAHKG